MNIQNKTYTTNDQIVINAVTESEYLEKDESLHFDLRNGTTQKPDDNYNHTIFSWVFSLNDNTEVKLHNMFAFVDSQLKRNVDSQLNIVSFFNVDGEIYAMSPRLLKLSYSKTI